MAVKMSYGGHGGRGTLPIWVNCPGFDPDSPLEHYMRDGCSSCAPYWERFPICPTHRRKLPTSGWCKDCRKFYNTITPPAALECQHDYLLSRTCGVDVCTKCGSHKGLVRCFCGWAASGGDGRRELIEMGETL